jgi:hypothetical protein
MLPAELCLNSSRRRATSSALPCEICRQVVTPLWPAQCPLRLTITLSESGLFLVNQKLDALMRHASARAFVVSFAHVSLRIPVLAAILVPRVHAHAFLLDIGPELWYRPLSMTMKVGA